MKTENAILMKQAREALAGRWKKAIGAGAVYCLVVFAASSLHSAGSLVSLIIAGPMMLGLSMFYLSFSRGEDVKVEKLFEGFKEFGRALSAYLLMMLYVILWALLLIIPGIIASISYSQIFFIMAEDNTISAKDVLRKSKKMMDGYKWKYFRLVLRFIGWFLLCILTLGIGFLWFYPYVQTTMAKFYDDISKNTAGFAIDAAIDETK